MIYSFSRLSSWETCRWAWYMNYMCDIYQCECGNVFPVRKGEDPVCFKCGGLDAKKIELNKDNAFSQYGTLCHEIIERYAKGELAEYEMLDEYESNFDIAVSEEFPPNAFADLKSSYYNGGYDYFGNFEGFDYITKPYKILGVEKEFETDFGDFKLKGFIDLLLEDGDGNIIIVDHKSKKEIKKKEDKIHYGRQTALYAKWVHDEYGKWPKELVYNLFRSRSLLRIKFTQAVYEEAVEWATKQVKEIEAAIADENFQWSYDNSSDFFCNYLCNFKDICAFKGEV